MKKDKDAGVMIQVVATSQFTLWIFERGYRLMPSNEFMSKLTMAEVTGVISHAGKLKVLDIWTEQFFETLQRVMHKFRCESRLV